MLSTFMASKPSAQATCLSLTKESSEDFQVSFKLKIVLTRTRKHDKMCDGVFLVVDKAAGMRQVSTPPENCEICNPSPVHHGQDSRNDVEGTG